MWGPWSMGLLQSMWAGEPVGAAGMTGSRCIRAMHEQRRHTSSGNPLLTPQCGPKAPGARSALKRDPSKPS